MANSAPNEAKEKILTAADRLFMERGYKAVTLRDVAQAVGIKHASLYHHVPGGKEQLFVEVTERNMRAHQAGLTIAIAEAGTDVRVALVAVATWLLTHPPIDLMRMSMSDLSEISPQHALRLAQLIQTAVLEPVSSLLQAGCKRGTIVPVDCGVIAGAVITMLEGLHAVPDIAFNQPGTAWFGKTRLDMAHYLIGALMNGLLSRGPE